VQLATATDAEELAAARWQQMAGGKNRLCK